MRHALACTVAAGALLLGHTAALAQNSPGSGPVSAENVLYEPTALEPTPERIDGLEVPEGFTIEVFAEGLGNTRMLAVSEIGNVYLTRREEGDLLLLGDGDGEASEPRTALEQPDLHSIPIAGERIFLATIEEVYATTLADDGTLGELEPVAEDLPAGGQHPNRTLALGPDGALYRKRPAHSRSGPLGEDGSDQSPPKPFVVVCGCGFELPELWIPRPVSAGLEKLRHIYRATPGASECAAANLRAALI